MSRRSRRQNEAAVTLFPFLAVLICTMGSLIVLLVVVVQQAGNEDPDEPTVTVSQELPRDVEKQKALEQGVLDLTWQADLLAKSREETLRKVQSQQSELSRAEDQVRQIKAELDRLYAESEGLKNINEQQNLTVDQVNDQRELMEKRIDEAAQRLADAQDAAARSAKLYSLVPYDGPNGTHRRPIFIECKNDRVVLQPEGVLLSSEDFLPPVENDNPLASAVRAIREYYVNNGIVRSSTEPYPLIIVRPDGASAFTACRSALRGWDDEFGYELLPYDVELAYRKADPGLRALLEKTVEEARWRISRSRESQRVATTFSVDRRTGGFVRIGGSTGRSAASGARRNQGVLAGAGDAMLESTGASGGVAPGGSDGSFRDSAFGDSNSPNRAGGNKSLFGDGSSASSFGNGPGTGDSNPGGSSSGALGQDNGNGTEADGALQPHSQPSRPGEYIANDEQSGSEGNSDAANSFSNSAPSGGASFDTLSGGAAGSSSGNASAGGGSAEGQSAATAQGNATASIARRQGSNWALPGGADGAIAIQRPVAVHCSSETLHLLAEPGSAESNLSIPWQYGAENAVREMVSALWSRIDGWGMAGAGAYWKPVIELNVDTGAERRFEEVSALLQDSGIIVIRR